MKKKKWYSWIIAREDLLVKVLASASGLFVGMMLGRGLQVLFA